MEALGRVIFYGASIQRAFRSRSHGLIVVLLIAAGVLVVGLIYRDFLWRTVRSIEWTSNTIGRVIAWAGLVGFDHGGAAGHDRHAATNIPCLRDFYRNVRLRVYP